MRRYKISAQVDDNLIDLSEYQLVAAAQNGDHQAFRRLYETHVRSVYQLCLRMISDPGEAELITQDVFVRAWKKLDTYQRRGPFGGWLRRITINTIIEERRRQARRRKVVDYNYDITTPNTENAALIGNRTNRQAASQPPAQEYTEIAIELERAIAKLPDGAKTAFVLHDIEGYRHREIAVMTGSAIGTIKAQLHRARHLLREALTNSGKRILT